MKFVSGIGLFWRRASRRTLWLVFSLVVVLVALRIALPSMVKSYVNSALNKSHDYSGKIEGVSIRLWRGGYQIHHVGIFKRNGSVTSPLFYAREVDLSIEWRELFHGAIVGEVDMQDPRINIVSGPTPQQTQNGKDESWDKMLEGLFPFKLNRFEISNGEVHFQNPYSKPPVDIFSSHIVITATNLSNARDLSQKLPSGVSAHGSIFGDGLMDLDMHLNLLKSTPAFEINCGVTNVNLVTLNNFLRAYGKFDVEHGKFALYTSVASEKGAYDGYFKVFFDNLNVFAWEKERGKNVLEIFWQAVVGSFATIFKNHAKDQLAAKVPISGSYSNSSVGVWTAIGTLLENAFIHALVPKLDQPATVEQVEKTNDQK
jgi:hypothetical protein